MRIIITGLMVCLSMAACNTRESEQTGGRYARNNAQLIARGKELASRINYANCLTWQDLKDMKEGDLQAWQAFLQASEPPARR